MNADQQAQLVALVNSFLAGNAVFSQADMDQAVANAVQTAVAGERARISAGFQALESQEAGAIAALINGS